MKVKNLRNRPLKVGEVFVPPGEKVKISDDIDINYLIDLGWVEVEQVKIKEKKVR